MDTQAVLESLERHGTYIKDRILARPILSGSVGAIATTYLLAKLYHISLRRQIKHIPHVGESSRQASVEVREVESLPEEVIEKPRKFRIVHDKAVKVIPGPDLGLMLARGDIDELQDAFTRMLRGNMIGYASTPQGWMTYFSIGQPDLKNTFRKTYINELAFTYGDRACGIWEVVKRSPLKVEFALKVPESLAKKVGPVGGLLVFSLRPRADGGVLAMENIQYITKESKKALPLDGSFSKYLHEVAAWRLLLKGEKFLQQVASERR